jgi:hypothetical protein
MAWGAFSIPSFRWRIAMQACKPVISVGLIALLGGFLGSQLWWGGGPVQAQAAAGGKVYEIRQVRLGNGNREAMRIHITKGEAWRLGEKAWEKVPEAGTLPAGNYDLLMMEGADKNTFYALRFDHTSGKAWNLAQGKWAEVQDKTPDKK